MGKRGDPSLRVEVVSAPGTRAPGLGRWLEAVAPRQARGAVTVALVPDARVRALNRRFRRTGGGVGGSAYETCYAGRRVPCVLSPCDS